MISFIRKHKLSNSVKEAFDNLPSGICFFDSNGILVLCNRQMYRLGFLLTGRDLQAMSELQSALGISDGEVRDGILRQLSDNSWWNFSARVIMDHAQKQYTEVVAFDVSELHRKQELLQEVNEAKQQTVETLEHIQDNIIAIVREEEILEMKMELHNELGYRLQTIRRFYTQGCPIGAKADFLAGQRDILRKMRGELKNSDEIDSFEELLRLAGKLGMQITTRGEMPGQQDIREVLVEALRECLTNTVRHAEGNNVFLELRYSGDVIAACITNNGRPPEQEIIESGGLSSLRKRIEGFGGTMIIRSLPEFRLEVQLPDCRKQ